MADTAAPETPDEPTVPRVSMARRFYRLAKAWIAGDAKRRARGWLAGLLGLSIAVGASQVLISYAARDFVTALSQRDETAFWHDLWRYLGTFALAIPIGAFYKFTADRLSLAWRDWMTNHLLRRYFYNRVYYRLRSSLVVDNPDERITEDVKLFTTNVLGYLLIVINSIITLIAFIGVLWSIAPKLVGALFGYAAGGTLLTMVIGRRLVSLHFTQYQKEADFRYGLVRVRDNAESIAFFRGEKREHHDLVHRFVDVLRNAIRIIGWNRNLAFFTNAYNYVALVLPAIIVAPMYMSGAVEFGVVTQAESAFAQVLMAMSMIVAQFDGLSASAAGMQRLGELWDELADYDEEDARDAEESQIEVSEGRRRLKVEELTVETPDGSRTLTKTLSLALEPGSGVLIMGESGSGKSSLLRTIAGLWQSGSGAIERPNLNRMMFLPQRPYMVQGTLREQLVYPQPENSAEDDAVKAALESVNLDEVLERVEGDLGKDVDWTNVLSLGEQQRVSFARLLLKQPTIAFLDEATSALDEPNERLLYERLRALGIAFVSVGHRSTLKQFHDWLLMLHVDGTWELDPIEPDQADARIRRRKRSG
jgi:putative ATP-binding cassette transporter